MQWLTRDQDKADGSDLLIDFNDDADKRRPRPHRSCLPPLHRSALHMTVETFAYSELSLLYPKVQKYFPFLPTPLR